MDGTSVFSTQFWVGKGMGRFFFSLDLMFGVQDGAHSHCENSDSYNQNRKQAEKDDQINSFEVQIRHKDDVFTQS